jgi:glycosyltransferase involved in cell wall biosynthesis
VIHQHVDYQPGDYAGMAQRCDGLEVIRPREQPTTATARNVDDWCPPELVRAVRDTAATWRPAAVIVEYVFLSRCLEAIADLPLVRVIETDNVFYQRRASFAAAEIAEDWFAPTEAQESAALQRADVIMAVQESDYANLLRMAPRSAIVLAPHAQAAVDSRQWHGDVVLAVGNDTPHNIIGLQRFVAAAWPLVRRAIPNAQLIVGGRLGRHFDDRSNHIENAGTFEDGAELYGKAAIALNATPCGTGLKIKSVDALCHGKALVSTPNGVEGLERYNDSYIVAPTPADFGPPIVRLLKNRSELRALANRAYEFAKEYFDPEQICQRLESAILARAAPPPESPESTSRQPTD